VHKLKPCGAKFAFKVFDITFPLISQFPPYFPPVKLYLSTHIPSNIIFSSYRVASEYSPFHPLCIRVLGEQASWTGVRIETPARVCADDQVFRKCLLLSSGHSRGGTMYIFLHELWSETLSNSPWVGIEPSMLLSMDPSAGYISTLKFVKFNLVSTMISLLFMNIFAANMNNSKITHVHIYHHSFTIVFLLTLT
jgi:hypothetical protein